MGLLRELRLRFRPPTLEDADFGTVVYMYIPRAPERSYWEAEWRFPLTGTNVSISLPGTLDGPHPQARAFYLALPAQFDRIIERVRPALDQVFREWLNRSLNRDLWKDVKLAGFGVDDPGVTPPAWDISFETTGEKWLGITIPFVGERPQEPVVDT